MKCGDTPKLYIAYDLCITTTVKYYMLANKQLVHKLFTLILADKG